MVHSRKLYCSMFALHTSLIEFKRYLKPSLQIWIERSSMRAINVDLLMMADFLFKSIERNPPHIHEKSIEEDLKSGETLIIIRKNCPQRYYKSDLSNNIIERFYNIACFQIESRVSFLRPRAYHKISNRLQKSPELRFSIPRKLF